MGDISMYTGDSAQRLFKFIPATAWVNQSQRNEQGVIVRDMRVEIALSDLA